MATKELMVGDVYYPSAEVVAQARLKDWDAMAEKARLDLQGFWAEEASELEWFKPWDTVLDDSNRPFYKWFVGAETNIVHNAIDRHLKTHRKNQLALIWISEDGQIDERSPTLRWIGKFRGLRTSSNPWASGKAIGSLFTWDESRNRFRHAGLRQNRRHPFGRVWRLFG